jgi:hypothetical protein
MIDRPPSLAQMPADASLSLPPGAWCRACQACHPPDHLPREAIRREGEAKLVPLPRQEAEPLFQQTGLDLEGMQ